MTRYAEGAETVKLAQCYKCRHFLGGERCTAFEMIPDAILNNFHDHRKPYPGDNGIRFEPIEQAANARR